MRFFAMILMGRITATRLFANGMVVTALSLLLCGFVTDFWIFTILRVVSGISGALVFIAGGTLAASLFADDPKRNAFAIALYFGGAGIGMILSGATLPTYFHLYGASAWPQSWIALGIASLVASVLFQFKSSRIAGNMSP